ncbi:MAG: hypothetical protein IKH28_02430 [Lachnospiraceae bacterium]|nr:hypothetical protein [Lachnospiraceae bacterium]
MKGENKMRELYEKYDEMLKKNGFLKRHTECLPFIGDEYEKGRLLLIGESHYLEKKYVPCVDREDFYEVSFADLPDGDYKGWIDTRAVWEYRVYEKAKFENFFANTATEIAKVVYQTENPSRDQRIEAMNYYAFMNYYKRPSFEEGKTINGLTEKDNQYAYDVSSYIMDVLEPKMVIFLSKKAYYAFCESDVGERLHSKYDIKCVSHPSSVWWNRRRSDGKCAREEFREYVNSLFN